MLETGEFGKILKQYDFNFFSGVPCSFLKNLINYSINNFEYIAAANEGDAVAIASGAYLGGQKSVVLMQNSGLTNAISPLTSLNHIFKIPILGFVSLRGEPGLKDEPQHELMGQITSDMLKVCRINHFFLSQSIDEAREQFKTADKYMKEEKKPFFFIVKENSFSEENLIKNFNFNGYSKEFHNDFKNAEEMRRIDALQVISSFKDQNTLFLASTGKCGRELYEIEDTPNNLYMVGSMGCVSSLALGLAITKPNKKVIAIDGDGALLMRMGSMATNGYYKPNNMLHILLDNGTHDSTGGQSTVSGNVDFVNIAYSSGYPLSIRINNLKELNEQIKRWQDKPLLTFLYVNIAKGSKKDLGRPSIKPHEVRERLMEFLK